MQSDTDFWCDAASDASKEWTRERKRHEVKEMISDQRKISTHADFFSFPSHLFGVILLRLSVDVDKK